MFYIDHNSDNFTIVDCQLFGDHKDWIVDEIKRLTKNKGIVRFVSTHPDEDHIQGIEYLDRRMPITNFYVVNNNASKDEESESFKHYCLLRDGKKAFYVHKGCTRKWMNTGDDTRKTSGLTIHWPNTSNYYFRQALVDAANGVAFNNISLVMRYSITNGPSFMWIGDLETEFMEDIYSDIDLPQTTVVFAPHHGRKTGKLPNSWLDKLKPKIIVIGEAESRHLHYYTGYNKITQTKAWDITFQQIKNALHCYSSNPDYGLRDWLDDEYMEDLYTNKNPDYYIGTLRV